MDKLDGNKSINKFNSEILDRKDLLEIMPTSLKKAMEDKSSLLSQTKEDHNEICVPFESIGTIGSDQIVAAYERGARQAKELASISSGIALKGVISSSGFTTLVGMGFRLGLKLNAKGAPMDPELKEALERLGKAKEQEVREEIGLSEDTGWPIGFSGILTLGIVTIGAVGAGAAWNREDTGPLWTSLKPLIKKGIIIMSEGLREARTEPGAWE